MPRPRPNSRVKDLPDIALLATAQPIDAKRLRAALEQTFTFRKTHPLPAVLPEPLPAWATPYAAMAREDQPGLADPRRSHEGGQGVRRSGARQRPRRRVGS